MAAIFERVNKIIKQIAEAEKYDIIFQEAVYANPRIDITDKVIKALGDGTK
jgi:outer membrane protein